MVISLSGSSYWLNLHFLRLLPCQSQENPLFDSCQLLYFNRRSMRLQVIKPWSNLTTEPEQ